MENFLPLKVLLVVEPGVDGVFRHVEQLVHFLSKQPGVVTHLAYSSVRGSPPLGKLAEAVTARGGRTLDLRVGNAPRPGDAWAFARLWRLARAIRPDVIHAHSSKAGVLARALTAIGGSAGARCFYTPHAYFQMHGKPGLKGRFFRAVERALKGVGTTINTSVSEAAYARQELGLLPERRQILLNGVDGERFRPVGSAAERRALREELNLPADAPLLGTVARLVPQKDSATLYRALLSALAERPGLHFAHLNAVGELAGEIEALVSAAPPEVRARVHRLPAMEEPARFFRALDCFVLPSRYEGFSLAALEAAASGLPLILTDCAGNADLRSHGFDRVWWTPTGDAGKLREQILAWAAAAASNPMPGLPVACNHPQVTRTDFNPDRQFQALLQLYQG